MCRSRIGSLACGRPRNLHQLNRVRGTVTADGTVTAKLHGTWDGTVEIVPVGAAATKTKVENSPEFRATRLRRRLAGADFLTPPSRPHLVRYRQLFIAGLLLTVHCSRIPTPLLLSLSDAIFASHRECRSVKAPGRSLRQCKNSDLGGVANVQECNIAGAKLEVDAAVALLHCHDSPCLP
jgi:hypothetical protein